jgi:hypothetical protein
MRSVQAIKILENWKKLNVLKIEKKKILIFSLWARQMKIIKDHIVFIKIFCCSKLKNCSLSSQLIQIKLSNFQTIQTVWLFEWVETGLISSLLHFRNFSGEKKNKFSQKLLWWSHKYFTNKVCVVYTFYFRRKNFEFFLTSCQLCYIYQSAINKWCFQQL